jgi:hypothetical protein
MNDSIFIFAFVELIIIVLVLLFLLGFYIKTQISDINAQIIIDELKAKLFQQNIKIKRLQK